MGGGVGAEGKSEGSRLFALNHDELGTDELYLGRGERRGWVCKERDQKQRGVRGREGSGAITQQVNMLGTSPGNQPGSADTLR